MEIAEHKTSNLEELSKEYKLIDDKVLDRSLAKSEDDSPLVEKSNKISFKGYNETQRDLASSKLQEELKDAHIYPGKLYSDKLWGGLDLYSGNLVHNALNDARNSGKITDSKYKDLMAQLKKACHHER